MATMSPASGDELEMRLIKMLEDHRPKFTTLEVRSIKAAYEKAKLLHKGICRDSGEAYLSHPLAVAELLAGFGFDSDVLEAALLHDTVEDTNYSLQELENEFGPNVRSMVDAVSKANCMEPAVENGLERSEQKLRREEATFYKLMDIARKHPEAIYIKFADRLHNLRTIDVKPPENQEHKREDTLSYIKIAKEIKSHYFYRELDNQCFRIHTPSRYRETQAQYESILKKNSYIENFLSELQVMMKRAKEFQYSKGSAKNSSILHVNYRKFLPLELRQQQENQPDYHNYMPLLKGHIYIYCVQIVYDGKTSDTPWDSFVQFFWRVLRPLGMHLDPVPEGYHDTLAFCLRDYLGSKLLINFITARELLEYELGTPSGESFPTLTDTMENLGNKTIVVLDKDKNPRELIETATALDFAFKVHTKVGLCAQEAYVNQRKVALNTMLEDGDEVEIESTSGRDDGLPQYQAKLTWFNMVHTRQARTKLIEYFQAILDERKSIDIL